MSAPERILADATVGGGVFLACDAAGCAKGGNTEYARADLLTAAQAEIARLRSALAEEIGMVDGFSRYERVAQKYRLALDRVEAATAKASRMAAALEYYADRSGDGYEIWITDYGGWTGYSMENGPIIDDAGAIARAALDGTQDEVTK